MKIEDQNVCLELSKEMKELGVNQDGIFGWYQYKGYDPYIEYKALERRDSAARTFIDGYSEDPTFLCSAPTVAELGEMLPGRIKTTYNSWNYLHITKLENSSEWIIAYHNEDIKGATEADARAKMWIFLKKGGLI
jgi:hypothetical protein